MKIYFNKDTGYDQATIQELYCDGELIFTGGFVETISLVRKLIKPGDVYQEVEADGSTINVELSHNRFHEIQ